MDRKLENECSKIAEAPEYKNILVMDTIPWGTCLKQRPHHIAEYLSDKFDVTLYKLGEISHFMRYNDKIILCPKLKIKKMPKKNVVYYIDSINEYRDISHLRKIKKMGCKIIYDYIDEFSNKICDVKKPYKIFKNLEKINPDVVVAASDKLQNDLRGRFPEAKIVLAKNATRPEDFQNCSREIIPDDIRPIIEQEKPIIGYYGVISRWLDYDLLSKAAELHPEFNFVFIGKDSQRCSQRLKMHENVYVLGRKKYEDLPKYAQHFDCCIIPFQNGNIAKATSPVKLYEYMALKKPVVCTRDLNECRGYEGVLMSENDDEFISNLSVAVEMGKNDDVKEKLWQQALENSWKQRADAIYNKIRSL